MSDDRFGPPDPTRPRGELTRVGNLLGRVVTHGDVNALVGPVYGPGITDADHRRRAEARARLSPERVAYWFGVLGDRLGRRLEAPTAKEYYYALAERLTTAEFERGAAAIFGSELYAQWPSVQAFVEEAHGDVQRQTGGAPTAAATAPLLAEYARQRADGPADPAALEDFARDWRAQLAHCSPADLRAERRKAAQVGPSPWLSDESRAALAKPAAPAAAAPSAPAAPRFADTPPLDPTDAYAI